MLIGLFPCIVFAGHLYAAERTYNVLFIQSYNHRTPWNDRLTEGVRDGLSRGGIKAKVTTEYLDADYWTFASECVIMRRICERARQKNTDIIITSSDEAFYTLMHCGDSLPYKLPVVISGIKYPNEKLISKLPNVCGYTSKIDFVHLLENARRVFPNRTEVICKNLSRSVLYFNLLTSGKLYEHLAEIDTSARNMAEYLIKEMAKKQGVTEELKATDMMRWIGLMNNIRACADEIVLNDIVYS